MVNFGYGQMINSFDDKILSTGKFWIPPFLSWTCFSCKVLNNIYLEEILNLITPFTFPKVLGLKPIRLLKRFIFRLRTVFGFPQLFLGKHSLPDRRFRGTLGVDEIVIVVDGVSAVVHVAVFRLQVHQELLVRRLRRTFLKL